MRINTFFKHNKFGKVIKLEQWSHNRGNRKIEAIFTIGRQLLLVKGAIVNFNHFSNYSFFNVNSFPFLIQWSLIFKLIIESFK